jgi:hypothetical protein
LTNSNALTLSVSICARISTPFVMVMPISMLSAIAAINTALSTVQIRRLRKRLRHRQTTPRKRLIDLFVGERL